jgi:putative flippase GtrA
MNEKLFKIIDVGYFLFKRFMPLKTYRYAVCGGGNMVFDSILYFVFYHFILQKQDLDLGVVVLSSHIASLFIVWPISMFTGFLLNKYVVFTASNLSFKAQIVRYYSVGLLALGLSYLCMKLFVDVFSFYPSPSKLLAVVVTVLFSYLMQNFFSFREAKK